MKPREIQPRTWNERGEPGHKVQRLQYHMRRAIPERPFVAVDYPAPVIDREAFGRNRWSGNIAAQAFQLAALMRLANGARVEAEAIQPGKRRNARLLFQRRAYPECSCLNGLGLNSMGFRT